MQNVFFHFNKKDATSNWIPTRYKIGCWVTLMARKMRGHTKDAQNHGGSDIIQRAYKACIVQF